jgi:hypothetical protein
MGESILDSIGGFGRARAEAAQMPEQRRSLPPVQGSEIACAHQLRLQPELFDAI